MTERTDDQRPESDPLGPDALDFWLGRWLGLVVRRRPAGRTRSGGSSRNGSIEESFEGRDAESVLLGRSLSVRDEADGRWRQTWVDSTGDYLDFIGVDVDGRIAFQRKTIVGGVPVTQRMVWLDVEAGFAPMAVATLGRTAAQRGTSPGRSTTAAQ